MIAYLVISHVNAPQVERLVRRLAETPDTAVFLRHDGREHQLAPGAFDGLQNVRLLAGGPIAWGSFDQVQAVLEAAEAISASGDYEWLILVSGQDYPCTDLGRFHEALRSGGIDGYIDHAAANEGRLKLENADRYNFRYRPVDPRWSRLNARLWRLNRIQPFIRFETSRLGSRVGIADRSAFRRRKVYRGSFWWALSRRCVETLLDTVRTHPELVAAYRHRLHPDESFVQTVLLAHPEFVLANDDLRYIRWDDPASGSPAVLGTADVPAILASRKAFARKFDTRVDANVLDCIDAAVAAGETPRAVFKPAVAAGVPPRLSIGMPVYNGENYIGAAIRSILNQTFTDFELIVSDNASTDATADIVGALAAEDKRIRFYRNSRNRGASFNFNRTFELARGEYFRQAAHDDTLDPACLQRCIDVLDRNPSVTLAYTRSRCIDELDNPICEYKHVMHFVEERPSDRFAAHLRRAFDTSPDANRGSNPACNPIFGIGRTAMLRNTPMVANYIASDLILLGELALHGRIVEVPEVLFTIRAHPTTSWAQNPTVIDVAAWFDPANRGRMISYMPHLRWYNEYRAAIDRAPISLREAARCEALLARWAWSQRHAFAREFASVGARYFGLRAWNGADARRFGPPRLPAAD